MFQINVLIGKMFLTLLLIIIVRSSVALGKNHDNCPAFITQGPKENLTIIRLSLTENEDKSIGDEINNRLNIYEWCVHARTNLNTNKDNISCNENDKHMPCYLLAWKSTFKLKNQLNRSNKRNIINFSNKTIDININNNLIEYGVSYNVKLKIIRNSQVLITKCFELSSNVQETVFYTPQNRKTESDLKTVKSNDMDLVLIGPDRIFCTNLLIVNAFIVGKCTNVTWKLKESPGATPQLLEYQGSRLELPPNTLNYARTYEIICELIDENRSVLISESIKVGVRKPKFIIRLQNKNQTVGTNQPIKIIAHVDIPKTIDHEVIWTCTVNTKSCGQFSSITTLYISKGFSEPGLYQFDLTVTKIGNNERFTSFVKVLDSRRSIEFDEVPSWINPSETLEITANMINIRSGCTQTWQSLHNLTQKEINEEYSGIDITKTNFYKTLPVFVLRDAFLKELAAFNDTPGNQRLTLKIQPDQLDATKDSTYFLRFTTKCIRNNMDVTPIDADIELFSNAPPAANNLTVFPLKGNALNTIFRFETIPAKDKTLDLPLIYSFGWKALNKSNEEIKYFSKIQDFYMVDTVLPYIKDSDGILNTFMTVCDNKESCITVEGPEVEVMLTEVSDANHSAFKEKLLCSLVSNDFERFTTDVVMIFDTYKSLEDKSYLDDLEETLNDYLEEKIKYYLDNMGNKNSIYEFISSLTATEHVFKASDGVFKNLVRLRGKLVNEKMLEQIVTDDERDALGVIDQINEKNLSAVTVQDIRKYFEATEFIITTSEDSNLVAQEKENFIKNMDKYLPEVCVLLYREPEERKNFKFKLQTAYIVLEKFLNSYFRNFKYVPNPNNEWETNIQIMLNQSWHMEVRDKPMCIAKAVLRNYLGHNGLLYYVQLFNNDMTEFKMAAQPNTISKSTKTPNKFKCSAYYDNGWNQCRKGSVGSSSLVCMCDKLGYFRIDNTSSIDGPGSSETDDNTGTTAIGGNADGTTRSPEIDDGTSGDNGNNNIPDNSDTNEGRNSSLPGGNTTNLGGGSTAGSSGTTITPEENNNEGNSGSENGNNGNGNNSNNNGTNGSGDVGDSGGTENNSGNNGELDPDETPIEGGSDGDDISDIETGNDDNNGNNNNGSTTTINSGSGSGTISSTPSSTEGTLGNNDNSNNTNGNSGDSNGSDSSNSNETSSNGGGNEGNGNTTSSTNGTPGNSVGDHTTGNNGNSNGSGNNENSSNGEETDSNTTAPGNNESSNGTNVNNENPNGSGENNENPSNGEIGNGNTTSTGNTTGNNENSSGSGSNNENPSNGEESNPGNPNTTAPSSNIPGNNDGNNGTIENNENPNGSTTTGNNESNNSTNENQNGSSGNNENTTPISDNTNENNSGTLNGTNGDNDNNNNEEENTPGNNSNNTNSNENSNSGLNNETNTETSTIPNSSGNIENGTNSNNNPGNIDNTTNTGINDGDPNTATTVTNSGSTGGTNTGSNNGNNPDESNSEGSNSNTANAGTTSTTTTSTSTITTTTTTTTTPSSTPTTLGPTTTTEIIAAGSFMSVGDQISFTVIGLCILGTSGLILFGIISKRVRKVRAEENPEPPFPMYADIFQKENMHE